jgi:predicted flap endonuclease-1-like 5' DNA nuclease
MRIRMITRSASPAGVFEPGDELHVDDDKARELIARGYADPVGQSPAARRETAVSPPPATRARPLIEIDGIGDARAEDLIGLGIMTADDLSAADPAEIAEAIDGVGIATATRWIQAAREA